MTSKHIHSSLNHKNNQTDSSTIIVGAGIAGVFTAYHLNKHNKKVTLIERQNRIAEECSFQNGGVLLEGDIYSASYHKNIKEALSYKYVNKTIDYIYNSKVYLSQCFKDPAFFKYSMHLLYNRYFMNFNTNRDKLIYTNDKSKYILNQIVNDLNIASESQYIPDKDIPVFNNLNLDHTEYIYNDRQNIHDNNQFEYKDNIIKADRTYKFDKVNSYKINNAIINKLDNIDIHLNSEVDKFIMSHDNKRIEYVIVKNTNNNESIKLKSDAVIIAAGYSTCKIVNKFFGINIPMAPMKGHSIHIKDIDLSKNYKSPLMLFVNKGMMYITTYDNDLRIGMFGDFVGEDYRLHEDRVATLKLMAEKLLPGVKLDDYKQIIWSGLRPMSPDDFPIAGRVGKDNLFVNTGYGMFGFGLGVWTSREVAYEVLRTQFNIAKEEDRRYREICDPYRLYL